MLKNTLLHRLPGHLVDVIMKDYVGCPDHFNPRFMCTCKMQDEWNRLGKCTNGRVVLGWKLNRRCRSRSMFTDGSTLYSYGLPIGGTSESGLKVLREFTAKGFFYSVTTSTHVNKARPYADIVVGVRGWSFLYYKEGHDRPFHSVQETSSLF